MGYKSQCRHLRTKMSYIPEPDQMESWRNDDSTTAQYWCLCTMGVAGPDGQLVAPEMCRSERACFVTVDLPV